MDGHTAIPFCKVCSAEGDKLFEPCVGKFELATERRKMATHLDLHPDMPDTWPLSLLDKLIHIEATEGRGRLFEEIRKMTKYP